MTQDYLIVATKKEAEAYYRVKIKALIAEAMDTIKEEVAQKYPNAVIEQGSLVTIALLEEDIKVNGRPDTRDWKVNLENADSLYARFYERGVTNTTGLKEAISKGDVEYVNMVVEKQLAAEKK